MRNQAFQTTDNAGRQKQPHWARICLMTLFVLSASVVMALDYSDDLLFKTTLSEPAGHRVAAALEASRRKALGLPSQRQPAAARQVKEFLDMVSRHNLEETALFMRPLNDLEERLFTKVASMQPPVVTRTVFANLRLILGQRGLLSPVEATRRGLSINKTITPDLEEMLYGAYGCVFASAGPIDGTSRYGEVIIRLRDSVKLLGWGSPCSGHRFFKAIRNKNPRELNQKIQQGQADAVTSDDYLHFSHFISVGRHWQENLAWQAVSFLRSAGDPEIAERRRLTAEALIAETDYRRFWDLFIPDPENAFGYIEARFPGYVPAEYFTSIEVPADRLTEVLSWPESRPYRNRIKPCNR